MQRLLLACAVCLAACGGDEGPGGGEAEAENEAEAESESESEGGPVCGDAACDETEDAETCVEDCGCMASDCAEAAPGDCACDSGCWTRGECCPDACEVCGACCGDGDCAADDDETCASCPEDCEPCPCVDGGTGDCDGDGTNGCETPLTTLTDCGGCGVPCVLPNATTSCATGTCAIVACDGGFDDCDAADATGCETPLTTLTDCGACAVPCDLPNAFATCATGECVPVCDSGWGNCDGSNANGCETPTDTVTNCGTCGTTCTNPNGTTSCIGGACSPVCWSGYDSCDGDLNNGCEDSLDSLTNCGACGTACSLANAGESCAGDVCTIGPCESGWGNCDGVASNGCENSLDSLTNCGACGTACSLPNASESCPGDVCTIVSCDSGWGNCNSVTSDGCENSLDSLANCGSCGTECSLANASESCTGDVCTIGPCDPGWGNCDSVTSNGCEDSLDSLANCGTCGTACSLANASESCAGDVCTIVSCDSGWGNCNSVTSDGCENSLDSLANCGSCGTPCSLPNATESCAGDVCTFVSCDAGWDNCDGLTSNGCETALNTLSNCGACGSVCDLPCASESCSTGTCTLTSCSAGCQNWDGSSANGCETGPPSCSGLTGNCDSSYCNGCETSLTSLSNCGGCGVSCSLACASESCSTGTCTLTSCSSGCGNCDGVTSNGCETSLTSLSNCGGCGVSCSLACASESCSTGTCTLTSCSSGCGNCDGITSNGCENDLWSPTACRTSCAASPVNCTTLPNVTSASCSSGTCSYGCVTGYGDCTASSGCETDLDDNPTCSGSSFLGSVAGDVSGSSLSVSGYTEAWYSVTVTESSSFDLDLYAYVFLDSPSALDYDLCVYCPSCSDTSPLCSSAIGDDSVEVRRNDDTIGSDGFTMYVSIIYYSGSTCATWTLWVTGNTCSGTCPATENCP